MPAVSLEGAKVAYEERGKGEPVILLHGWNGTRKQWLLNLRALAPRFRAIAPDLPGFGESDDGPFPYTLDGMASFLEAFREALRLPRFHLAGHSMGGCIAIRYTSLHAERVERLVLVSTPTRTVSMGLSAFVPGARCFISSTYRFRNEAMLKWMFYRGLYEPERQDLDFVRANVKAGALTTRRALSASTRLVRRMDLSGEMRSIDLPTLIVFGNRDRNVNPKEALRQRDLLSRPYMTVLNSCAHCPHYERPDLFNTVLLDFLLDKGVEGG
ncbi:MAG: alpha/beta hydrolase [Actinomycetota bacterium]|nr:alpha/beta hydrolase [Actinomycetota bacterium]MDD5666225.1 alpha/beta hydrolase [Actinomycetota bacterium]